MGESRVGNLEWLIRKDGCMHCEDPGCLKACPAPGAIVQYSNGIVDFVTTNCIGCGYCIKGCPFNIPRISKVDNKAYKCTLCSDRVAVGQGPACAKACPTQAIVFGTKDEMKKWADKRIADLKSRGFTERGPLRSAGSAGHACDVCAAPRRQAAALRGPCQQSADQPDRRILEGPHQICRPRG
jgi:formate dehydrogenase iron-sulfur subunit